MPGSFTSRGAPKSARRNLSALERAIAADENDAYLWFQLGATCRAIGDNARAIEALERALELDPEERAIDRPTRATIFIKLAQIALAHPNDALAAELAEKALTLDARNALALHILGVSRLSLGDEDRARQAFSALATTRTLRP